MEAPASKLRDSMGDGTKCEASRLHGFRLRIPIISQHFQQVCLSIVQLLEFDRVWCHRQSVGFSESVVTNPINQFGSMVAPKGGDFLPPGTASDRDI
jgi:hypothetical protein